MIATELPITTIYLCLLSKLDGAKIYGLTQAGEHRNPRAAAGGARRGGGADGAVGVGAGGALPGAAAAAGEGEKDAKLAQKLGQLQPFTAVFPQECMGQLASFGPA